MYHKSQMYSEALNTYQVIVKNKMFSNAGTGKSDRLLLDETSWNLTEPMFYHFKTFSEKKD